jgi:hypothetical protein
MTCIHLQQLVQLCEGNQIKLSSSDLIHMVCEQCGKKEVCPSALFEEFVEEQDQPTNRPAVAEPAAESAG